MKRETTNRIRFIIEELLPPALRDTAIVRAIFKLGYGDHIDKLADFRKRAHALTPQEYQSLYELHPRVHHDTDNSAACIALIAKNATGESVCDIGCGTGYLLKKLKSEQHLKHARMTGVDFILTDDLRKSQDIRFVEGNIEKLPFPDASFDTVICTHVLEHILDIRQAVAELRRIARKRLILVVPREREYIYTFNPHFHFFPYAHSFLRMLIPVPKSHSIQLVGRDYFYTEDIGG